MDVPARERLYRRFAAEEVAAALRHRLVNKIAAVGALAFHLRRQLPEGAAGAGAAAVVPMLDAELAQASQALDLRFVPPAEPRPAVALADVVNGVLASIDAPAGVKLTGPTGPSPTASVDVAELDLALFCLVENAVEAVGSRGTVEVRFGEERAAGATPMSLIEVVDDGPLMSEAERHRAREVFYTTKPGRLGIGINMASRIALRWRGMLELAAGEERGLVARVLLPVLAP